MNDVLQFFRNAFNLNIKKSDVCSGYSIDLNKDLYSRLNTILNNSLGSNVYTCDISPENLMSYKNGKISSILKDGHKFSDHYGFDVVSVTNIADTIINEINSSLIIHVTSYFNRIAFDILNSFQNSEYQINGTIIRIKENEYIDEIESFKLVLEEMAPEIGIISTNQIKRGAYLTNIIDMRKRTYKIYNYYLKKLKAWSQEIGNMDYDFSGSYTNVNSIDFNELNSDICFTREIISIYMITIIYEYLLAGDLDDKSENSIKNKVEKFIGLYKAIYKEIEKKLLERNNNNKLFNWNWRNDKRVDSSGINWLLDNISNNQSFEINTIEDIFTQIRDFLNNIDLISE